MADDLKDLIDSLSSRGVKPENICSKDTDLVVEGFPRSSNSFCVSFLDRLMKTSNKKLSVAHHSHIRENCELAVLLQRPCLILIREPASAIASYVIFSGQTVEKGVERYLRFYENIFDWEESIVVADFDLVIEDFNSVVRAINEKFGLDVPLSENPKKDAEVISHNAKERAKKAHGAEEYFKKVGTPTPERDLLKGEVLPKVVEYLESNTKALDIYKYVKSLSCYIGNRN